MENLVYENANDVVASMNTGDREKDLEMVNAVLSGSIQIRPQENEEEVKEEPEDTTTNDTEEDKTIPQDSTVTTFEDEEAERQKRYYEMLEKRRQEEKETLLREKREKEEEAEREKRLREDLEKRIREIEERNQHGQNLSQQNDVTDEDEEFVSDYTKKTRKMVEDLKKDVGANYEMQERINEIESALNADKAERQKLEQEKKRAEEEERVFNGIRNFLSKHPDMSPSKDVREIDKEYKRFRQDIAYVSQARSLEDLERAIDDYKSGGRIKELADQNGVKGISDIDKYDSIVELIDFKDGLKYDPVLGKHVPILDENGVQVRYRSLEEAYNIKNYYDNLSKQRRDAYRDVSKKLEGFNNAPVLLDNEVTGTVDTSLTVEQEREYINMDPKKWINDPEKRKVVEKVYLKYGIEPPKYRGRKY